MMLDQRTEQTTEQPHGASADQFALALRLLGVTNVKVYDSLIQASHHRQRVNIRLCRENIPFVWWTTKDGEEHIGYGFQTAVQALGADQYVKPGTILIRALKSLGLSNSKGGDFYVHGEYNSAKERIHTIADLRGQKAEHTVVREWDELKGALDLTGYDFKLMDCAGVFHYITD